MTDRTTAPGPDAPQLFLSYNSRDHDTVVAVREHLQERGLSTFLDREHLIKGLPWHQALEQALAQISAVAVFIGRHDLGIWQKREMGFALDRQAREERAGKAFPVIPVLLPGSDLTFGFLFLNTWVDLRDDLLNTRELDSIFRAVGGEAQRRTAETRVDLLPYRGLEVFRERDTAFFCGREIFTERLLDAVLSRNLVAVVGPSGSGKSSVVQAGLLPALRKQRPPATTWDAAIFTPGNRPYQHLADALISLQEPAYRDTDREIEATKLGKAFAEGNAYLESVVDRLLQKSEGTDRLLLVADQFEELFTTTPDTDKQPFIERLLQALEHTRITLVVTLRADFYGHALNLSRAFSDRIEQGLVNLGPMTREELERSIRDPATRVGLHFEAGLEAKILDDVADQPGNLPLLEFALTELWVRRQRDLLTHAAYEDVGGVSGALAKRAEAEYKRLTPDQQRMARQLFTRLVRVAGPDEGNEGTRRRAELPELDPSAEPLVRRLAAARLLVTSGHDVTVEAAEARLAAGTETRERHTDAEPTVRTTVEVAHEALIRGWERLREWLNEDRGFLLWRQRLSLVQTQWKQMGNDPGSLLRSAALTEAEHWLHKKSEEINKTEKTFIQASLDARAQEQKALERRRRNLLWGLASGLLMALLIAGLAIMQWKEAEQQRNISVARQLSAEAITILDNPRYGPGHGLVRSILMAAKSLQHAPTLQGYRSLLRGMQLLPHSAVPLVIHKADVMDVSFSPDGTRVATASDDNTVRIVMVDSSKEVARLFHENAVRIVRFAPDGSHLATASVDDMVRLWDTDMGKELFQLVHNNTVRDITFSPDGERLATASRDGTARVWDVATGTELYRLNRQSRVNDVDFSLDGTRLVTASKDGTARLWEVATGKELARLAHEKSVDRAVLSPDGRCLATASKVSNTAWIWDTTTGEKLAQLEHDKLVLDVSFSPDGKKLATVSAERRVHRTKPGVIEPVGSSTSHLWDIATGKELLKLRSGLLPVNFSPDGARFTTTYSGIVYLRDTTTGEELARLVHRDAVHRLAFRPDGSRLVTASRNTVWLWNTNTAPEMIRLSHEDMVSVMAYSRDGKRIATLSQNNTARIWNAITGEAILHLANEETVSNVAFSPDGANLAIVHESGLVRVWDTVTAKVLAEYDQLSGDRIRALSFSPRGPLAITTGEFGGEPYNSVVSVFNMTTGKAVTRIFPINTVEGVALSPDGERLVTVDSSARIWDVRAGKLLKKWVLQKWAISVRFSPDGKYIATHDGESTVLLWEAKTGKELARLDHKDELFFFEFSSDGTQLATVGSGIIRVWQVARDQELFHLNYDNIINEISFSADSKHLVAVGADGTVQTWEIASGNLLSRLILQRHGFSRAAKPDCLHLSSDGRWLTACIRDYRNDQDFLKIWNVATGEGVAQIESQPEWLRFSADGTRLATEAADKLHVWDVPSGRQVAQIAVPGVIEDAIISPNGTYLVVRIRPENLSSNKEVIVWDIESNTLLTLLKDASSGSGLDAAFSLDGTRLAIAIEDTSVQARTTRVWDVDTGTVQSKWVDPQSNYKVALNADGTRVAVLNVSTLWVGDNTSGRTLQQFDHGAEDISAIAVNSEGSRIATGGFDGLVHVWDVATGEEVTQFAHGDRVWLLVFEPDGIRLASVGWDEQIEFSTTRVWDISTGKELFKLAQEKDNMVFDVSFSPDGRLLAIASNNGKARLMDAITGEVLTEMTHEEALYAVAFSPDGRFLATGTASAALVWDLSTGSELHRLSHTASVWRVAFTTEGKRLLTADKDDRVRIWDLATGKEVNRLNHHNVFDVSFSSNGKHLATTGSNSWKSQVVRVWDLKAGKRLDRRDISGETIRDVSLSADGMHLAIKGLSTLNVWNTVTRKLMLNQYAIRGVNLVTFSANGHHLATKVKFQDQEGNKQLGVKVWDVADGEELAWLKHEFQVGEVFRDWFVYGYRVIALSTDGSFMATVENGHASHTSLVRVWNVEAEKQIAWLDLDREVHALSFSPDDRFLAMASGKAVRIWLWRSDDLITEACTRLKNTGALAYDDLARDYKYEAYLPMCEEQLNLTFPRLSP